MQALTLPNGTLHVQVTGPDTAPAVVFANSLGTDLRLWDRVLPLLPQNLRFIRYDKRGHGLSVLGGGTTIAEHAEDAIAVIEQIARGPVVFVGLSIGGLIGQVVAHQRPDLVRALVLSNTAAKLGTADSWQARIGAVNASGLDSIADAVMERWFAPAFRAMPDLALWRAMLTRTPAQGYVAACAALFGADQREATAELRLPVLVIAGSDDGASPSDVVRQTADLIPGAAFHEISGAGHLPPVEAPAAWAALVAPFLKVYAHD
ncbi:MAG: 3-oxoadipate enol-lactonase [Pseudotabrizicola sp.]|uniref:3-oxoadipate enol-lactonase n=1 Tax=Pseudotabrizicola sp. TaxID=2939647 RepID=UPI00271702B1|nr:3-oxoadipate enol-lactonase [Pseudotabrizicola sp.]MDO8884045.1 3-oxoadipate enol-lactonase [Pseudotabrizicola sp.]MDP2080520.1 3-oxoadipate enol-lactonase [Pseudotabrizicola sp.]MDZ7573122.1 3-oxoadipate enol-lactonase [Pseudotabrizicola sp.]